MKLLLIDMGSLFRPIWEVSTKEPDRDFASRATVERVRAMAPGFDGVAVCCDSPKSWRKDTAPSYKANRPPSDAGMLHQLRIAEETLEADGFPVWKVDGFEADDLIASFVAKSELNGEITVASSDKDLMQLVCDDGESVVRVRSLSTGKVYGPHDVVEKFGVRPDQMRDWLILVGDKSDNVTGVKGIGEKRAAELLGKHGSLYEIYAKLGNNCGVLGLTPATYSALAESVAIVELGRKLVSLRDDVPLPFADILKPRVPKPLAATSSESFDEPIEGEQEDDVAEVIDAETGEVTPEESTISQEANGQKVATPTIVEVSSATSTQTEKPKSKAVAPNLQLVTVDWDKELEPRSPAQAASFAARLFDSRMFSGYGNENAVLSTILLGRELGIGMMGSLRGIHNIKGKHALSADLMAALVLQSGKAKFFEPVELTATKATYRTHRIGSAQPFTMTFDFAEAVTAGLVKDDSGWKKWPLDMCKARVIARLARAIYPDVCFGLYVPEELDVDYREAA